MIMMFFSLIPPWRFARLVEKFEGLPEVSLQLLTLNSGRQCWLPEKVVHGGAGDVAKANGSRIAVLLDEKMDVFVDPMESADAVHEVVVGEVKGLRMRLLERLRVTVRGSFR